MEYSGVEYGEEVLTSSPVKTSDNFEKFADELALLDSLPPGNDDSTLKKDLHEENFQENTNVSDEPVLLNTPLSDKVECFAPEDNNDEIDDFLAMEVSDPLHHEFAGEPLTLPARNDREFEEYLSLVTVLNEISTSQGNVYQIQKLSSTLPNLLSPEDIFTKNSLAQDQAQATSAMVKAQRDVGFCAKTLTKEAQCHPKENDMLAIFRCPYNDQTAIIASQMIEETSGYDCLGLEQQVWT
ncbi:hypothetical protein Tco_0097073 [Tanacetum coccineum]